MMFGIVNFAKQNMAACKSAANAAAKQYYGQQQANTIKDKYFKTLFREDTEQWGTIVVQTWPEGLVIYVGGRIVYKSWENVKQPTGTLFG